MNIFNQFRHKIQTALQELAASRGWPDGLPFDRVTVEPPRDAAHGDISTNAAMLLAKPVGAAPRAIAGPLAEALAALPEVEAAEVAGPGFINLRLAPSVWLRQVSAILEAGTGYGHSDLGAGRRVNVEYVSANPTGPLHAAHARGAVFGDALAALLEKAGFAVTREYYINDAGSQVETLARTAHLRYREALGEQVTIPEGHYPGEYLKEVGQAIAGSDGDRWVGRPEAEWLEHFRTRAVELMVADIKRDLLAMGIRFDVFSSERAVVEAGAVQRALDALEARGLVYTGILEPPKGKVPEDWEPRPQLLFKASEFGDDVDRPLKKSDGSWTYFANDIAYHHDKFLRGSPELIDVLGADHGGYVKRMKAAVTAITGGEGSLDVKLCQIVHLFDGGRPVRMSKRAGTFVTLRDVQDAVGPDVVRFIMLTRRNDQTLDFDYQKVREQSRDNPVFYVQYAHARATSVLRHAAEALPGRDLADRALAGADLGALADPDELGLIKLLAGWPRMVESAADAHEPHRVAFYLGDVAAAFHGLWNKGKDEARLRFILPEDERTTLARLALVRATATVIASGLGVMGVHPVEELRE